MKLKIFDCKSKYARLFRVFVCCFAAVCTVILSIICIIDRISGGAFERLFNTLGLMGI